MSIAPETLENRGKDAEELQSASPSAKRPRSSLVPVVLILTGLSLLALLQRTQSLSTVSFWFDEACSWKISQFPVPEMLDAISRDAHPPLYYFLMKFWTGVFGSGVVSSRSFSVLAGVGSVLAACWLMKTASTDPESPAANRQSRPWESLAAVLVAGLLVAVNPLQVEMGQEARPYSLGVMLSLLSATFALRVSRMPQRIADWIGFVLTAAAVSLLHYYGIFTLIALILFLVVETIIALWKSGWSRKTKQLVCGLTVSLWSIQLIWLPWISIFLFQRHRTDTQLWMKPLTWNGVASTCWKVLAGGKTSEVWTDWTWLAVAIWSGLAVFLIIRGRAGGRLIGLCAIVPLIATLAYGLLVRSVLGVHYLIFAETFVLLGVALLAARGQLRLLRWTVVALVIGWNFYWSASYAAHRQSCAEVPGTQGAIAFLNDNRQPHEPVIVSSPLVHTIALQYLRDRSEFLAISYGDHRSNILSGPPMQDQDYVGTNDLIQRRPPVLWTINADGLFGRYSAVDLPKEYQLVAAERFPERFGYRMDLVVRKYELQTRNSTQQSAVTQTN